jgi:RNA polymerase sigma-70 factor, ECF subfamily
LRDEAEIHGLAPTTGHRVHDEGGFESLMVLYQEGDPEAAVALIQACSPRLYRFFLAQAQSRVDADDLLQETWLRIHRVRHTYRAGEPALPWFYAIARHVRIDHYRKARRSAASALELEARARAAEAFAQSPGRAEDLESLLAPLSDSQREVLEMLKVTGMSLEEVARATSSSVGSVKQKVHRAYKRLRETMSTAGLRKERKEPLS